MSIIDKLRGLSHKHIERGALIISFLGLIITAVSVLLSTASTYFAFKALSDQRAFAFDISCGPAKKTTPDAIKMLVPGDVDFPTFSANGDTTSLYHAAVAACTIYNLSKEPVPRISFVVVVSDGKRRWVQNVIMEGFFPESSRVVWLESRGANIPLNLEIGRKLRYIDPVDHRSHVTDIPDTLANVRLLPSSRS